MVINYSDSGKPPLDEARIRSLETGTSRLGPDSDGLIAVEWLWDASVAEARGLHRLLALRQTAPRAGEVAAPRLASLIRIMTRQIRSGQTLDIGEWHIWLDEGRDDLDRSLVQWSLARTGGPSRVTSKLTLLAGAGQSPDASWPLPFELLTLEDSDAAGRLVSTVIERDEDDAVFVGSLTTRGGAPTGNPTDFGVVLRRHGAPEWTGGDAARSALESSAKSAAAAAALEDELRAAELARQRVEAESAAPRPTASGVRSAATAPRRKPPGKRIRSVAAGSTTSESIVTARKAVTVGTACNKCGAALIAGAAFCATCGAPVRPARPVSQPLANCAGCGASLTPGMAFCAKCGRPVASGATPVQSASRCASCGADLKPDARFCRKCGAAVILVPIVASRSCAGCGNELAATARFCRRCGKPVQGGAG